MAIQQIDLQTLFTQMDKVAKTQSALREGAAMQQAIQEGEIQRKKEELIQSVNQAQDMGEGAQKVKDKDNQNDDGKRKKKTGQQDQEKPEDGISNDEKTDVMFFRHPFMGRNIDISL